ncbi:Hydroxyethylthiazole kinase [Sodalis glossinidius str. 'morsitans']|uniref:hydroxyethylthiazole kinase n=1 Tax=Sodalis glossinidius (strain morsitans) TaxID=343509 RepID=Q2NS61_SODGM|nr:hydroxyethylthiazole kinase [Sodalis glossinidius]BAE75014.1 putative hydoxyethylthiazole kinase [Sodalis glossinidius str. 'morsitans']CRL45909.1 Hydroxyethylthiazole kinase [Sodalis glossinidius str. 'morsitans']
MQPSELPGAIAAYTLQQLRHQAQLVHCFTNDVVQTLTANILLELGASPPPMVVEPEEAAQFSAIADALLINIGTLCQQRVAAMLAGIAPAGRCVDSGDDSVQALPAARVLAKACGAIVAVTGAVDLITDGNRTWQVDDGHPLMTRVTGTGCVLSAVAAACCALPGERLDNVAGAFSIENKERRRLFWHLCFH